jgi:hypothetical protein
MTAKLGSAFDNCYCVIGDVLRNRDNCGSVGNTDGHRLFVGRIGPKRSQSGAPDGAISSLKWGEYKRGGSSSDSEEKTVEEDKQRHSEFGEDLRTLQRELAEDMKFDLMEREAAIEMVRQNFRAELANPPAFKKGQPADLLSIGRASQPLQQPLELHHTPLTRRLRRLVPAQQNGIVEKVTSLPSTESVETVTNGLASKRNQIVLTAGQQRAASLAMSSARTRKFG